tara:strand:- start:177 stop:719 length:543 start_codon:yes stop_codon:yes gene_type:complete
MVNNSRLIKEKKNKRKTEHFASLSSDQKKSIMYLLIVCVILIVVSFAAAYFTLPTKPSGGVAEFLGFKGKDATVSGFFVGLVSSVIFGMIDNGGLYFGMDALDPILPGDDLEKAGWGNTFSDFLGGFLGTFIGIVVKNLTKVEDTPLYSEVIGIVIGCILGIYIPKLIKGDTTISVKVSN